MRFLRVASLALAAVPLALSVACSSSSSDPTNGSDGGNTVDTGSLVSDDSRISAAESNGFDGPGPDGSTCELSTASYSYEVGTKKLTWSVCRSSDGVYTLSPGERVLTDNEAASFRTSLDAVRAVTSTNGGCATDQPSLSLTIDGTTYLDQSLHCNPDGQTYADGVKGVLYDALQLAHD